MSSLYYLIALINSWIGTNFIRRLIQLPESSGNPEKEKKFDSLHEFYYVSSRESMNSVSMKTV